MPGKGVKFKPNAPPPRPILPSSPSPPLPVPPTSSPIAPLVILECWFSWLNTGRQNNKDLTYLKQATQLVVGHPKTKDLSGLVLPSQTSSMQDAVHISQRCAWLFSLKCSWDLKLRKPIIVPHHQVKARNTINLANISMKLKCITQLIWPWRQKKGWGGGCLTTATALQAERLK